MGKSKTVLQILVCVSLIALFAGCSTVKQYSVESYQGLLPVDDHRYFYTEGSLYKAY